MNCRFCGTIVGHPPADCPKCGRPVSAGDVSRNDAQSAIANIVYRKDELAGPVLRRIYKPRQFIMLLVTAAVLITAAALNLSRPKPTRQNAVSTVTPPASAPPAFAPPSSSPSSPQVATNDEPLPRARTTTPASHPLPQTVPDAGESEVVGPSADELAAKAQAALDRGDWLEPKEDSAVKWAREAQKAGKPSASRIEDQVYSNLMKELADLRSDHNYDAALKLVEEMIRAFPNHNSLASVRSSIIRESAVNN